MNTLRKKALEWWEYLDTIDKMTLCNDYLTTDDVVNRTQEEIEMLYQKDKQEKEKEADKLWYQGEINPDL